MQTSLHPLVPCWHGNTAQCSTKETLLDAPCCFCYRSHSAHAADDAHLSLRLLCCTLLSACKPPRTAILTGFATRWTQDRIRASAPGELLQHFRWLHRRSLSMSESGHSPSARAGVSELELPSVCSALHRAACSTAHEQERSRLRGSCCAVVDCSAAHHQAQAARPRSFFSSNAAAGRRSSSLHILLRLS